MIGGAEVTTVDVYACGDCETVALEKMEVNRHKGHVLFARRMRGTEIQISLVMQKARDSMRMEFAPKGFRALRIEYDGLCAGSKKSGPCTKRAK